MIHRAALMAAATVLVASLVSACSGGEGSGSRSLVPQGPVAPLPATLKPPARAPKAKPRPLGKKVAVTVVDGDTHRRLHGARVVIGRRADYANGRGRAILTLKRRMSLEVTISKPGYITRTLRMPFRQKREVTTRIYKPARQWTMFGVNPSRTGAHTGIAIRPPFRTVWSRGLGSLVEFPAVVYEGVAYIGNYKGTIYAVSMRNGKIVWKFDPPGGKMASSPAVSKRDVVVHGMDGLVRVLDRRNGKLRWQYRVGSPVESSPVIVGGVDYFGAWNGRIYALDLKRRKLRWSFRTGYKITSSAAISKGTLYIGDYGGRLVALSAQNGRMRFKRSVGGRIYGTPAVAGGRVFVPSSTGGSLTAFSTSGRYLWRINTGSYVYSTPAVWAGRVFFGSYNGRFYGVSAKSGRILWSVSARGPVSGAAVVVAGVAYAGSTWGHTTGVDAKTGKIVLSWPHGEYVPVSGNAQRLLLHGYSRIWAVEPRKKR